MQGLVWRFFAMGVGLVSLAGCKTDQEKLVGTWQMDCVGMVERLNGKPIPDKVAMCEKKLGITIVLAPDGGFSFTSKDRLHQRGTWSLKGGELVWVVEQDKPSRNRYEVSGDDLFLESPVTGAILVMKRTGPGVLAASDGKTAEVEQQGWSPDRIGRTVVEAVRTRDVAKLTAITPKGMSAELAAEMKRTRELTLLGTFDELLEALDGDGIPVDKVEFDRIELDNPGGSSIIHGAEVHFRAGEDRYYVSLTWTDSGKGPALVGLSRWYKAVP